MSEPAIQFNDVTMRFGKRTALSSLNLSIPPGSVTAFLGPNGAGKTTAIKLLLGLYAPVSGDIKTLGFNSRKLPARAFEQIGYVSENQKLPLWMTVQQLLDYCRPLYPAWDRELEARLVKDFALPLPQKLKHLSRGQSMKAALLSSLAYRPRLVVLDEPFSGLDPLARDEFINGLLELTEGENWTVFISSHDISEVERLADRVAILNEGRLQLHESTADLQQRVRRVTLALPESLTDVPAGLPATWLLPEPSGRLLRYVDTAWDDSTSPEKAALPFPGAVLEEAAPLTLREIFVVFSRQFRLDSHLPAAA
jgi:ABC-2 type transport system ATP-binding protein